MKGNKMIITDLDRINELCKSARLSVTGKVYLNALLQSYEEFGKAGLQEQVAYILANGRWPNKAHRKSLEKYSREGRFE